MFINSHGDTNMVEVILRLPEVKARTGLCRSAIYQYMNEGTFPESVSLGVRAVGWKASDVQKWIERRIKVSRAARSVPG